MKDKIKDKILNKILIIEDSVGDEIISMRISEQGEIININNAKFKIIDDDIISIQQIDDFLV